MSPNSLKDNELLDGLRNESAESFRVIYDRYWTKLYQVAYRKTGTKEVAEELVQEIFLNLWLKRKTIVITSSLEAYLFTAVKYAIINHFQSQLVRTKYQSAADHSIAAANYTEESVITSELNTALKNALALLSAKTCEVFEKSRFQNLSNKEIAHELQLTDKAVEFHITKTLKHLKIFLKDFVVPLLCIAVYC
ncbi:RNA polymerase sigma-70 factor [Adhaeribacter swui]|uniref:RNA polymerase sigma-70 factor n=1 Tax=Adhaeribacter swui TaxID=2086471 RepID=A0A7G7G4N8_9BACT|nr:RNA polymerase sigma-70 factor [Adhaeribacter swui]QNF32122.1 RNA polymerase sigma-70 factor [Adhaeribacter swui]